MSGAARASSRSSAGLNFSARTFVNCRARASRSWCNTARPDFVNDITTCRPSCGSGRRRTNPRFSNAPRVTAIACGVICSERAKLAAEDGPPRSSRAKAVRCGRVNSSGACNCLSRRTINDTPRYSAPVNSSTSGSSVTRAITTMIGPSSLHSAGVAVRRYPASIAEEDASNCSVSMSISIVLARRTSVLAESFDWFVACLPFWLPPDSTTRLMLLVWRWLTKSRCPSNGGSSSHF